MNLNTIIKDNIFPSYLELEEADDDNSSSIFNSKIFGSRNLYLDSNDLFSPNSKLIDDNNDLDIFKINPFELKFDILKSMPLFLVEETQKKRGRKSHKISNKKPHLNTSKDNVISKIQIHFLNFVIKVINDYIYYFTKNKRLKLIKFVHSEINNVSKLYINNLKNWNLNDLIENLNISTKYKRYKKNNNRIIRDKLKKLSWFQQLSKVTIPTLFNIYYNNKQPLEKINLIGTEIIPSDKRIDFYNLLQKNKNLEKIMIETAENDYIKKKEKEKI